MSALRPSDAAPGLLLGEDVQLGEGVSIGGNVVIHSGVVVGAGCTIQDGAVLGKPPMLGPYSQARRDALGNLVLEPGARVCCGAVLCTGAVIGRDAVIGDHTFVREGAEIGAETVLGHGTAIGPRVQIGARVKLQNNVVIATFSLLEDDVFFGPLVTVTNDASMGRHPPGQEPAGVMARRGCRVGAGAILLPGIELGSESVVGAGALVTSDVPANTVVIGSPARELRRVSASERLQPPS